MLKRHAHRKSTLTHALDKAKKKSPKDFYLTHKDPCLFFRRKIEKLAEPLKNLRKIKRGSEKNRKKFIERDKYMKRLKELYTIKRGKDLFTDSGFNEYVDNKFYEKFLMVEMLNAIYSAVTIALGIFHYEMTYKKTGSGNENLLNAYSSALYVITLFSISLWVNIVFRYVLQLQIAQMKGYIRKNETIWSTHYWIYILLEIAIFFIHPNIATDGINFYSFSSIYSVDIERSLNSLFVVFLLARCYYIVRFVVFLADDYMHPKTDKICKTFFFKPSFLFSLKAMFKSQPFFIYCFGGMVALISFSFGVRLFERELDVYTQLDFNNVWNSWWYICITMQTVGYGDFYAKSSEGRFFAICACIIGLFLSSMMFISLSNYLSLNPVERTAFNIMKRVEENDKIGTTAKQLINKFGEFVIKRKKIKRSKTTTSEVDNDDTLVKGIKNLSDELNRQTSSKFLESMSSPLNASVNTLNFLDKEYFDMKKKQVTFQNDLHEIKQQLRDLCDGLNRE